MRHNHMRGLRNDVAAPPQQLGAVLVCCVLLACAFGLPPVASQLVGFHSISDFTRRINGSYLREA